MKSLMNKRVRIKSTNKLGVIVSETDVNGMVRVKIGNSITVYALEALSFLNKLTYWLRVFINLFSKKA